MNKLAADNPVGAFFASVPKHVPPHLARYYTYWKIFYFLGSLAHLSVLLLFWQTGVRPMAVFGIFSVATYLFALFLLIRGYFRLAFWIAIAELILHGIAATVCVGIQYGFQQYALLVLILLFIQPFYGTKMAVMMAALTLTSTGLLTIYALNNPPLYQISGNWSDAMTVTMTIMWPVFVLVMVLPFIRASARAEEEVQAAYGESERLLLNILPSSIAEKLKASPDMIADDHEKVAILFVDIVGFTELSERLQPGEVVALLNQIFNAIDDLVSKHGCEKIKTIGDAYMVVAGLPKPVENSEKTIAQLALDIRSAVSRFSLPGTDKPVQVRIGINSGKVVAGVIGNRKFAYDLWGDAVNVASRMEATGLVGAIQMPDELAQRLADHFQIEPRGLIEVKGKGKVATSLLIG